MRNLRLLISYDGTDFFGWQRQPDRPTIQGRIENALQKILGAPVDVMASGRTDAGVHASGQVANFRTDNPIPCSNLRKALNNALPPAVRVLDAREAPEDFHARFAAHAKVYRYRILQTETCSPFLARFVHHLPRPLDLPRMEQAARLIVGRHDFTSFAAQDGGEPPQSKESKIRSVYSSRFFLRPRASLMVYEIRGDGFLRHMVRNIIGTLIEVGEGRRAPADIRRLLAARYRPAAGSTAPACGLCLVKVEYDGRHKYSAGP